MKKKLTTKQKRFIEAYNGNGTQAAIKAGYSINAARSIARENLTKPHIKDAINKREDERNNREIATRERRQEFWTGVMRDESEKVTDRLRASELLAKANGDFLEKSDIDTPGLIIRMPDLVPVGTPVSYLDDEN